MVYQVNQTKTMSKMTLKQTGNFKFNYTINGVEKSVKLKANFNPSDDGVDVVFENYNNQPNYQIRFDGIHNWDKDGKFFFENTSENKCRILSTFLPSMLYGDGELYHGYYDYAGPMKQTYINQFNEQFGNPKWETIQIS
jgi:hypothetical protein